MKISLYHNEDNNSFQEVQFVETLRIYGFVDMNFICTDEQGKSHTHTLKFIQPEDFVQFFEQMKKVAKQMGVE
jgi:hypothetical protein